MTETCISCGGDNAEIRIQTIMGSNSEDIWLCRACADKHGIDDKEPAIEPRTADLLSGLLRQRPAKRRKKSDGHGGDAVRDTGDRAKPASTGGASGPPSILPSGSYSRGGNERSTSRRDSSYAGDDVAPNGRECPSCGLTLARLKKTGKVGCVHCYTVFRPIIETVMKEQSFAARHIGRIPERYRQFRYIFMERERLARDLHTALGKEDYEEAARIHADILKMDAQEGTEDDTEQS